MLKSYYLKCKSLHSLPKFASKTQRIQVGNWSVCWSIEKSPWLMMLEIYTGYC